MRYRPPSSFRFWDWGVSFLTPALLAVVVLFPNLKSGDARASFLLLPPEYLRLILEGVLVGLCWQARHRFREPAIAHALFLLWLFAVSLAFSLFWTSWGEYSSEKISVFYFHTIISIVAPLILLKDEGELNRFLIALAAMGLLYGGFVGIQLLRTEAVLSRYAAGAPNPITVGRFCSIALLLTWISSARLTGSRRRWLLLSSVVPVAFLVLAASRGPILACVVALFAWWFCFFRRELPPRRLVKPLLIGTLVILLVSQFLASSELVRRFERLFTGEIGGSETGRMAAYTTSLESIFSHPFGLGWGGFEALDLWSEGQKLNYPHNLLLEVGFEAGWPALAMLLTLLVFGVVRGARRSVSAPEQVLFALLVAFFVNAFFSGDINTNRLFWVLLGLTLGLPNQAARLRVNCTSTAATNAPTTRSTSPLDRLVWKGRASVLRARRSVTGN